jgi:general secretion pathway protein G
MKKVSRFSAFTILELLVAMAILSMLSALLLPVFFTARGRARQTVCASNLQKIGQAVSMYVSDNDSFYPRAVDPSDVMNPAWQQIPDFASEIPRIPQIQTVLQPYTKSKEVFRCPADIGFAVVDFSLIDLQAFPSSFQKYGTSYYYRTELAAYRANDSEVTQPARINLLFDGVGEWHGTLTPQTQRYNVLFADGHVKNISRDEIDDAWQIPLASSP